MEIILILLLKVQFLRKQMEELKKNARKCRICADFLPHGCRPVFEVTPESKIIIIGQAPGRKVHESGVPWQDKSGDNLREWLGITEAQFYDPAYFAILPMGFCYPGKGKSGDLPPRPECAPKWHPLLLQEIKQASITLLIGQYAQNFYLGNHKRSTLTETVKNYQNYLPNYFPLPHPSPRNNIWRKKNPWFEADVLPQLKKLIEESLK